MKRSWHIWIPFSLCLAVVLVAMGWISLAALDARRQAAIEENVRLALWRMDFALAPVLAQESARPYFVYSPFLPVDRAYGRMFNPKSGNEVLVPSPLLDEPSPHVLVYFQFHPDGRLTSPRLPTGGNYQLAVPDHISEEAVQQTRERLKRVQALADPERLMQMLPEPTARPVEAVVSPLVLTQQEPRPQQADAQPRAQGALEFQQRTQALAQSTNVMVQSGLLNTMNVEPLGLTDVGGVPMSPLWLNEDLVLVRRIAAGGQQYVQGCLLDWPAIKTWLLEMVEDLLPEADLEPAPKGSPAAPGEEQARMLAALPVRLIPGPLGAGHPLGADGLLSPAHVSLLVTWGCVLLAAAALAILLRGLVRLSERRAAFVSAVTHELRTPLTTFHMYTEMLAEGMVPEGQQRQHYLNTLQAEAARLSHLVENVLSYARLERGRWAAKIEDCWLGEMIEPSLAPLADRARQAAMELVVEEDDAAGYGYQPKAGPGAVIVRANPSAVQQILFNLVDNACKYAADACDRRIHLTVRRTDAAVQLSVRDHGPGISHFAARRLFRPFSKSAQEAANSAPGVGLGLALSRRLARDMGGQLRLDKTVTDGACFVLTLAASSGSSVS